LINQFSAWDSRNQHYQASWNSIWTICHWQKLWDMAICS